MRGDAHEHSADAPIEDSAEDLLHRASFAFALARDIARAPRDSGFVVGLTGPWGSGKTSVLRLIERELGDDATAVISFNPWLFSGTEQLVEHFFAELSGQLEAIGGDQLGKVTKALRGYGRVVAPLRYLPYVGEIARASSDAASDLGGALGSGEAASAQIQAAKLKKRLIDLERPIVVMVDDIDRLRKEEIVDVVRLVRLVGDFPNLIYLLAFDLGEVESALGDSREDGRAYLDKIVHISHSLPPVRPEELTLVLQASLSEAIPEPSAYRFDRERLVDLFWTEVRPMFTNVRDIRRYVNVLATTLALLGDEVDLADILALEALRLFEPEAFEAIVEARYALTGARSPTTGLDIGWLMGKGDEKAEELITRIPALAPRRPEQVRKILRELFPLSEVHFGGADFGSGFAQEWKRTRRVADIEVLDIYLYRRLAPGALPAREVEKAVVALADPEQLREIFDRLGDDELRGLFSRLADFEGAFPDKAPEVAIDAILARGVGFGDSFRDMSGSMLIVRLLRGLSPKRVKRILDRLAYPNLSRRYDLVRMVDYHEDGGRRMVEERDAAELTRGVVDATLELSAEQLAGEEDLGPLILLLQQMAAERLQRRLSEWLSDDRFFVRLVFAHRLTAYRGMRSDGSANEVLQLNWPPLLGLVGLTALQRRTEAIDPIWVKAEFGEDVVAIWDQARYFINDPAAGEEAARRWPSG